MIESSSENRDKIISREDHKNGIKIDLEHRDKDHLRRVTEDMGQDHSSSFETLWGVQKLQNDHFWDQGRRIFKAQNPGSTYNSSSQIYSLSYVSPDQF